MSLKSSAGLLGLLALFILLIPRVLESDGLFVIPSVIGGPMNIATASLAIFLLALTALYIMSVYDDGDEDKGTKSTRRG